VQRIGDATLPEKCFRHYLEQDYLFLVHFSRAWALAVYKAETLSHMRAAATTLGNILSREMALHVEYCTGWGLTEKAMAAVPEAKANMAYTRYVLDLHVALAPCVIGYVEIGSRLVEAPTTKREGSPYRDWIEMYAGDDYQAVADESVRHLEELAASRLAPGRFEGLVQTFRQAVLLEIGFWDMGLNVEF
jgi:thiaminase/transcriptional activator TenA